MAKPVSQAEIIKAYDAMVLIQGQAYCNQLARQLGVHSGRVSQVCKAHGRSFDRSQTAAEVAASKADISRRRSRSIQRIYTHLENLLDRLERGYNGEGWDTLVKEKGGGEREVNLPYVPPLDERNVANSLGQYSQALARLELTEAGVNPAEARSMVSELIAEMRLASGRKPELELTGQAKADEDATKDKETTNDEPENPDS